MAHANGDGTKRTALDWFYLPAVWRGLKVAWKHLVSPKFTAQYPEKPHTIFPRFRGVHKLNRDHDGRIACVACLLCETNCPAFAIRIKPTAAPAEWKDRERYPQEFQVDLLRCIYCGYCEEACPVDAIALTNRIPPVGITREEFVLSREQLLTIGDQENAGQPRPKLPTTAVSTKPAD